MFLKYIEVSNIISLAPLWCFILLSFNKTLNKRLISKSSIEITENSLQRPFHISSF